MQTEAIFAEIVEPARKEYLEAEDALSAALAGEAGLDVEEARATVLRRARIAGIELH